jgi:hypothetical protein
MNVIASFNFSSSQLCLAAGLSSTDRIVTTNDELILGEGGTVAGFSFWRLLGLDEAAANAVTDSVTVWSSMQLYASQSFQAKDIVGNENCVEHASQCKRLNRIPHIKPSA